MKVIGINGSSRKDGNTAIIIRTIFEELNKRGIETEFIQLADVDIEPCRACFACKGKGNCVFRKDGFAEVFRVSRNLVGIIFYTREVLLTSHYEKRLFDHASQPRVAGADIRLLSYLWSRTNLSRDSYQSG